MASTASDLIKFEKMATGEKSGTWGTLANQAMSRIEEAIADITNITLAGSNYTLDDTQYLEHADSTPAQESHVAMIKATGTPGATRQVIVPLRNKQYIVWNATTDASDLTVGGASGDTVTITNGNLAHVFCDGTNVEFASPMFTTAGVLDMKTATGLAVTNSNFIVGDGTTFVAESGTTAMTSLGGIVTDTTPQLGGDLDCNGAQVQWSKGADVASATALAVLTDGNYFDVTGTTTITSINTTGGPGTLIKLHFDGVVTLTHHATDLILAGAANFTTEAGDELEVVEYASGDYRMTGWSLAGTAPGGGGGGAFLGEGASGASVGNSGDIIRVNQQTLDTSQSMSATDNGSCTGPFAIASGVTLTLASGSTFKVL